MCAEIAAELRDYCHEHGIIMTAHRPLAVGDLAGDTVLREHRGESWKDCGTGSTPKWLVQQDIITIPKSGSVPHLRENLDVFEWQLTDEEMR